MSNKIKFSLIIVLFILTVFVVGCFRKECETNNDCLSKNCFTAECNNKKCAYVPIGDCCGNKICETGETYSLCAADCPNCEDNNVCTTKERYDYHEQKCIYDLVAPCYLRPITLTPATPEVDYQVKVELSSANFNYSKVRTNGEDIRFFDENNNPLSYWIEDWNGVGGVSTIWVKVTSFGTDKIYMYYGHPDASSASLGSAVFEFFDDFDYSDESELIKVWNKHGNPIIKLSDGVVTIASSGVKEHEGQHIFKNVGSSTLLNNIVEIYAKRFSDSKYQSHMANIGYTSSSGGGIGDGDCWAALRYKLSLGGSHVVFGGNHGSLTSSPVDSFNIIKIYHQAGISYAYEPPIAKVAEYKWPMKPPFGDYILLGGATTISGDGKASYDWIRFRKYASTEPVATIGKEEKTGEGMILEY